MSYVRWQGYNASIAIRLDPFGHVSHLQQAEIRAQGNLCLLILQRPGRDQSVQYLQRSENRRVYTLRCGSRVIPAADGQFSPHGKSEAPEEVDPEEVEALDRSTT